jgi:hypothetical protein
MYPPFFQATLWTFLSTSLAQAGQPEKAEVALAESQRLAKHLCSKHVHLWWFLGPFPVGMPEVDGDPVGDLRQPSFSRQYYSELGEGDGVVKWQRRRGGPEGEVEVTPAVDWNDVVGAARGAARALAGFSMQRAGLPT